MIVCNPKQRIGTDAEDFHVASKVGWSRRIIVLSKLVRLYQTLTVCVQLSGSIKLILIDD